MNTLIIGKHGQVAQALMATKPTHIEALSMGRKAINIWNVDDILKVIKHYNVQTIINTAAYTHVDLAQSHVEEAFSLNEQAAANIAAASKIAQARLIHLSTDYVFSGEKRSPYLVTDVAKPINIYGESKLAGERAAILENSSTCIVRTSWLYSQFGDNFVKTILSLMEKKEQLAIIDDQASCPTSAIAFSQFLWRLSQQAHLDNIYHWSDLGSATWFEFAQEIHSQAMALGKLPHRVAIEPISSEQFQAAATRPSYSQLDITHSQLIMRAQPWKKNLFRLINSL